MSVPEKLVEVREKNGYTRKRLAEELGRPYRTITKYENGEREPGHEYIVEIAKKFNVTTDFILGLESEKSSGAGEAAPEEEILRLADQLNDLLVSSNLIRDGEDVTDSQADVILAVCRILRATFQNAP